MKKFFNGPEAFTPDADFVLGETDVPGFWRRGRRLCARARRRRRDRQGDGRVDRRRPARSGTSGRSTSGASTASTAVSATRSRARTRRCRSTTTSSTRARRSRRAGRCACRRPTRATRSSARRSARRAAGSASTGTSRTRARRRVAAARAAGRARTGRPRSGSRHCATREAVGLFDQSSFSKLEVIGPGALAFLERLCANRIDRPVGTVVYTQMLNARGGIEADLSVHAARGGPLPARHRDGVRRPRPCVDREAHAARRIGVRQRRDVGVRVLRPLGAARARRAPAAHETSLDFPYMQAREIEVGDVPCLAVRVTYVGELGLGALLPDRVRAASVGHAVRRRRDVPAATARSTRCASRRATAPGRATCTPETTPYEAGLGFAVKLDKGEFIGRDARAARAARRGSSVSCSTIRGRSRSARSRCALAGGDDRRARHERRLRLRDGSEHRARVRPARRTPSRVRAWRSTSSATGSAARCAPSRSTTRGASESAHELPRSAKAREPLAQFPGFDARHFAHRAHARQGQGADEFPAGWRS